MSRWWMVMLVMVAAAVVASVPLSHPHQGDWDVLVRISPEGEIRVWRRLDGIASPVPSDDRLRLDPDEPGDNAGVYTRLMFLLHPVGEAMQVERPRGARARIELEPPMPMSALSLVHDALSWTVPLARAAELSTRGRNETLEGVPLDGLWRRDAPAPVDEDGVLEVSLEVDRVTVGGRPVIRVQPSELIRNTPPELGWPQMDPVFLPLDEDGTPRELERLLEATRESIRGRQDMTVDIFLQPPAADWVWWRTPARAVLDVWRAFDGDGRYRRVRCLWTEWRDP